MIRIKSKEEISLMRQGGRILAEVLQKISSQIREGLATDKIDKLTRELVFSYGARPSFLGYSPNGKNKYPAAICVSLNNEVVHGIPSRKKVIQEGDLVKLDLGVFYKGLFTDAAVTVACGCVSPEAKRLINVTQKCLKEGIKKIIVGKPLSDYSQKVQGIAEKNGYSVVKDLVGHGVGFSVHEEPQIPNYGKSLEGVIIKPGMTFALEPMVNEGSSEVKLLSDGWTFVTADGKLNAHFEHTVATFESGPEVLTEIK